MDLNHLLYRHQRALIAGTGAATSETRHSAAQSVHDYAGQIATARLALGRYDPFTWSRCAGGSAACV